MRTIYKIDNGETVYTCSSATAAAHAINRELKRGTVPHVYEKREHSDGRNTLTEWVRFDKSFLQYVKRPVIFERAIKKI